jgi:hypothetical protein
MRARRVSSSGLFFSNTMGLVTVFDNRGKWDGCIYPSDAIIPGAVITLDKADCRFHEVTKADANGFYEFLQLAPAPTGSA